MMMGALKVGSGGGSGLSEVKPIFLTAFGTTSTSITIPADAKYIVAWQISSGYNNISVSVTGCSSLADVPVDWVDFSDSSLSSYQPTYSVIRIFKVNSTGNQTATQVSGGIALGYITEDNLMLGCS